MELNELIEVTKRAEKIFDKTYNNDQLEIMFEELKDLSKETYAKAIKHCINNCKYLPKIADIRAFTNENRPSYREDVDENNGHWVNCNRCNKGFIRYYKPVKYGDKTINYEYIALCNCTNGKIRQQQGYNYPVDSSLKAIKGETNIDISKYRNDIKVTHNVGVLASKIGG